jgi:hypothetical protein
LLNTLDKNKLPIIAKNLKRDELLGI